MTWLSDDGLGLPEVSSQRNHTGNPVNKQSSVLRGYQGVNERCALWIQTFGQLVLSWESCGTLKRGCLTGGGSQGAGFEVVYHSYTSYFLCLSSFLSVCLSLLSLSVSVFATSALELSAKINPSSLRWFILFVNATASRIS